MKKCLIIVVCILYVVSPIDVIPDFLLGVGWLDDLAVIGMTARKLAQGEPSSDESEAEPRRIA